MLNSVGLAGDLVGFLSNVLSSFLEFSLGRINLLQDSYLEVLHSGSIPCHGVLGFLCIGCEVKIRNQSFARIVAQNAGFHHGSVRKLIARVLNINQLFTVTCEDRETNLVVIGTGFPSNLSILA